MTQPSLTRLDSTHVSLHKMQMLNWQPGCAVMNAPHEILDYITLDCCRSYYIVLQRRDYTTLQCRGGGTCSA